MRQRSARAAAVHRQRIARLRATTHEPPRCGWPTGCTSAATDAHESLNRSQGGDPTDPDWLLCRTHHDRVTSATGTTRAWCLEVGLIRVSDKPATLAGMSDTQQKISYRMKPGGVQWLDDLAAETTATRSRVIRAAFVIAARHRGEVLEQLRAPAVDKLI